jgi:hypothetical protein
MPVSSMIQARIGAASSILGSTKFRTAPSSACLLPWRLGYKMMQRLMLGADFLRRKARRHRRRSLVCLFRES